MIHIFFLSCSLQPTELPKTKPDILLVVLDTTRADAFMSYGNHRKIGTNAHNLAQESVLYTQAWASSSWTWPSHASLFTGLYPWEHGAHFAPPQGSTSLKPDPFFASEMSPEIPTLAQKLQIEGYETVSFSANRLVGPDFSLTRGFEISEFHNDDAKVSTRAITFLENRKNNPEKKPLFMFINLMSAHTPWFFNDEPWVRQHASSLQSNTAPEWILPHLLPNGIGFHPFYPNFQESLVHQYISGTKEIPPKGKIIIRDLYEAEVKRSDAHFGLIYDAWNNSDSIVALTSDHGEYLTEHRLLEHGRTLLPEVLHVPMMLKAPGQKPRIDDTPITMHQLHHQILKYAGFDVSDNQAGSAIYAGAWEDHYWSTSMGAPFDRGYRLKRDKNDVFIMDDKGNCTTYTLIQNRAQKNQDTCTVEIREELALLFQIAQTGNTVQPSNQTLEQLQQLGYIGDKE